MLTSPIKYEKSPHNLIKKFRQKKRKNLKKKKYQKHVKSSIFIFEIKLKENELNKKKIFH